MKVLVVGSGGREHALVYKIAQSPKVSQIYCAPGNGGIAALATCVNIKATDISAMVKFVQDHHIDLTVVGPEDALALGMVDALTEKGFKAFGCTKAASRIEGSKLFSKNLMKKYGIPTAGHEVFEDYDQAKAYILAQKKYPTVLKADGLALGKGVIIAQNEAEAIQALKNMMLDKAFGTSGLRVVIEEFMQGTEVTVLSFIDGKTVLPMVSAQDHKRIFDEDKGPNTGGMGTISPNRHYSEDIAKVAKETIIEPTLKAMAAEGCPFKGVLYFELMLTAQGPKVIEYNARFGDPEAQVVLPRLQNDIVEIFEAIIEERLNEITLRWDNKTTLCVVLASKGYPGPYTTGKEITGLDKVKDAVVFHAGTCLENGKIVTSGGRVLGVTVSGRDVHEARQKAYTAIENIHFDGMQYRNDIGLR